MADRKILDEFIEGLTDEELGRVLRRIRGYAYGRALSHAEFMALQPAPPVKQRSEDEEAALAYHAAALERLDAARSAFTAALRELRAAERRVGPQQPDGTRSRTPEQRAEIERLADVVAAREEALDAAEKAEVRARPHQRRTQGPSISFPLAGIFKGRSPTYPGPREVRHG
jgi:hypothetical protein